MHGKQLGASCPWQVDSHPPSLFPQVNIGSTKGSCRDKQVSVEKGVQRAGWAPWKSP